MKKTIQFFIKSAIIFVLCSQLVLSSSALTVTPITPIDPCESYAMQMVRMVDGDDEQCPWDNTTAVSSVIPLYDCNNNVNGYIYNLSTNLKDTGFVQIFYKMAYVRWWVSLMRGAITLKRCLVLMVKKYWRLMMQQPCGSYMPVG